MIDTQKALLIKVSDLQAELDKLKADIKETEKTKDKDNANSN